MKKLLLALLLTTSAWAQSQNELTLYFLPSPAGIDWSTPRTLLWSGIKNELAFSKRSIGHVFVELKCGAEEELTGMSVKNFDYLNQLLMNGRGLGIFYHSFEGELEEKEKIKPELNELLKSGDANFTRFKINSDQCKRAQTYLNEYRKHDVGRHYGLAHRPLYGEGSGCSAFGISFLEVLKIMDAEMKESWSQTVLIPHEYSGPPVQDEPVGIFKLLLDGNAWATHDQKHKMLKFWNPDKMYQWVKQKVVSPQKTFEILKIQNSQGVVFDKAYLPTPEEPIWRQGLK